MVVREARAGLPLQFCCVYAGGLMVLSLIPRKLYKICFNKVSELSKQQIRDIPISLNLSTVGVCMGIEVPQPVERAWEFA